MTTTHPNPLLDPSRWCKNTLCQHVPGEPVKRCMLGWMRQTLKGQEPDVRDAAIWEVRRRLPEWAETSPIKFWDHPDTTHAEAIGILKEAGWIAADESESVSFS